MGAAIRAACEGWVHIEGVCSFGGLSEPEGDVQRPSPALMAPRGRGAPVSLSACILLESAWAIRWAPNCGLSSASEEIVSALPFPFRLGSSRGDWGSAGVSTASVTLSRVCPSAVPLYLTGGLRIGRTVAPNPAPLRDSNARACLPDLKREKRAASGAISFV